ncbi:MAG TPA: hypothetical protein VD930_09765 [Gemmatimonadales bacterium]|nr:hypothetical protein [Gemmatimonadales bacterium]
MAEYTPLVQRTLQLAKQYVGQREATGRNDGWFPRLVQRFVAKGSRWLDNQPWCVCYATYVIHTAAKELGIKPAFPNSASSSQVYAWAKQHGKLLRAPVPGCVGLVRRGGQGDQDGRNDAGKTHIHTFIVHDIQGTTLITTEGNYRNSVCWNKRRHPWNCDFVAIG